MKRALPIVYTISTVLIIVGALFILQDEEYGLAVLLAGVFLNVVYRAITLNISNLKAFKFMDVLRFLNILLMLTACLVFFLQSEQKFNILILAIVFDLLLNSKEISVKSK